MIFTPFLYFKFNNLEIIYLFLCYNWIVHENIIYNLVISKINFVHNLRHL